MMKSGDHVVCTDNMYGGTGRLFDKVMANYGLTFTYVDTSVAENVAGAITPATKLVHIETPTNPMMSITDIAAVARICHAKGVELSVDNTFLSPYLQQPIALGADIVMHSTTKFLNGHSDGLGGVLVCTKPEQAERFRFRAEVHRGMPNGIFVSGKQLPTFGGASSPLITVSPAFRPCGATMYRFSPST